MKTLRDLKIRTQLIAGLSALIFFVLILGFVSYMQTNRIHKQNEILYEHSLIVRRAIGHLESSIYMIHWALETVFRQKSYKEMLPYIDIIRQHEQQVSENLTVLKNKYYGPPEQLENIEKSFNTCKRNREDVLSLFMQGKFREADSINIHKGTVIGSRHMEELTGEIRKISLQARQHGEELHDYSNKLIKDLTMQLILIIAVIIVLALIISINLLQNIRTPLKLMTNAAMKLKSGDIKARSNYRSANEFGELSETLDGLAASIQKNQELNNQIADLSGVMIKEDDDRKFFRAVLTALCRHTGAQMAAVYLLSDDLRNFVMFDGIGLNEKVPRQFSAIHLEGELGMAVSTKHIQHIKRIPADTRFTYLSVCGSFVPEEIITLPIVAEDNVIAIISLASVKPFDALTMQLIEKISVLLGARITGILGFKKIREVSYQLELQNHELESQKTELYTQSSVLTEQNTELEIQKTRLDEANRLKTIFLSNMSHELRTPLNSIIALSGVLGRRLSGKIPDDESGYIQVIERNGKQLLSLINDILDISRIEAGREEIDVSNFNLNNLIAEVVGLLKPQSDQKKLELIHHSPEAEIKISTDAEKCRHILQNLIGNSIKFTEKGKVEIVANQKYKDVEIKISDTGIGIEPEHLPFIFDEFRQGDSSISKKFGGSGLGLAISMKYAKLLNGTIEVESTPGKGSAFRFILPQKFNDESSADQSKENDLLQKNETISSMSSISGKGKTVLLIEDSEPAVIQVKLALEENGFRVRVARNGFEALEQLARYQPDGIILDLMMPEINGFELLGKIRQTDNLADIPVLILTAMHLTKAELETLRSNNIFQLIQKGDVNLKELMTTVNQMVTGKRKPSGNFSRNIASKPLIMLVESNGGHTDAIKNLLHDEFDVFEVKNADQVVEQANRHKPDLIIMDIALPGVNGLEMMKKIKSTIPIMHIPVVALTTGISGNQRKNLINEGFSGYFDKPVDEIKFLTAIRRIVSIG